MKTAKNRVTQPAASTRAAITEAAYLCVFSRSDPDRSNVPMVRPTSALGGLMLDSGVMPVFKAIEEWVGPSVLEPIVRSMPLAMIGVEVHERLHRMDIRVTVPDERRGVRASNVVGEHSGIVEMQWLVAPDDFEPAPGRTPPPTPLDETRSQRFVMLDGRQHYLDCDGSGLRCFGTGRTFPTTVNGQHQLRLGGVVNVLDGSGNFSGLSGTIVINGHVSPPHGMFINFVARFVDPGHQLLTSFPLSEPVAGPEPDPGTTFLLLVGEPDPNARRRTSFHQRLRLVHTGFEANAQSGLRSHEAKGRVVGHVTGRLEFDPAGDETELRLTDGLFTFTDPCGHVVGTIAADITEGRAFKTAVENESIYRVGGFGPLIRGTGAFHGAVGMLATNGAFDLTGRAQSNLYIVRISDPTGRYRASVAETRSLESPTATHTPRPEDSVESEDAKILACVERTRRETLEVRDWWHAREATGDYTEPVDLVREFDPDERLTGFFDSATVNDRPLPVMGVVQEMFYDRPKASSPEQIRDQLREFVLGYFMRVSHRRQPDPAVLSSRPPLPLFMKPLSWLPELSDNRIGFGYEQLLYQRRDTGRVGKFGRHERGAIVDLRTIGTTYDWVAMRVNIFDFKIGMSPFGADLLKMELPLREVTYLLVTPELIVDHRNPAPGVLGEYGFGYGLLPYTPDESIFAYGPGHFAAGFQSFVFRVLESGEIRATAAFVVNRPDKILSIDVDPVAWSFKVADLMTANRASTALAPLKAVTDLLPVRLPGVDPVSLYIATANMLTGGLADRQLGISKAQLEKHMLVRHFIQHRQMLVGSQFVWRMVPDWKDRDALPEFCHRGLTT